MNTTVFSALQVPSCFLCSDIVRGHLQRCLFSHRKVPKNTPKVTIHEWIERLMCQSLRQYNIFFSLFANIIQRVCFTVSQLTFPKSIPVVDHVAMVFSMDSTPLSPFLRKSNSNQPHSRCTPMGKSQRLTFLPLCVNPVNLFPHVSNGLEQGYN